MSDLHGQRDAGADFRDCNESRVSPDAIRGVATVPPAPVTQVQSLVEGLFHQFV